MMPSLAPEMDLITRHQVSGLAAAGAGAGATSIKLDSLQPIPSFRAWCHFSILRRQPQQNPELVIPPMELKKCKYRAHA